jgi:hypothetical protein
MSHGAIFSYPTTSPYDVTSSAQHPRKHMYAIPPHSQQPGGGPQPARSSAPQPQQQQQQVSEGFRSSDVEIFFHPVYHQTTRGEYRNEKRTGGFSRSTCVCDGNSPSVAQEKV